jgi:hypothetical protein
MAGKPDDRKPGDRSEPVSNLLGLIYGGPQPLDLILGGPQRRAAEAALTVDAAAKAASTALTAARGAAAFRELAGISDSAAMKMIRGERPAAAMLTDRSVLDGIDSALASARAGRLDSALTLTTAAYTSMVSSAATGTALHNMGHRVLKFDLSTLGAETQNTVDGALRSVLLDPEETLEALEAAVNADLAVAARTAEVMDPEPLAPDSPRVTADEWRQTMRQITELLAQSTAQQRFVTYDRAVQFALLLLTAALLCVTLSPPAPAARAAPPRTPPTHVAPASGPASGARTTKETDSTGSRGHQPARRRSGAVSQDRSNPRPPGR